MSTAEKLETPKLKKKKPKLIMHKKASSHDQEPAKNLNRVIAALIDSLINAPIYVAINYIFVKLNIPYAEMISPFVATTLYFGLPTYKFHQTLGKKIMKIKVLPNKESKEHSLIHILLRENLWKFVSAIFFGLGYFFALLREDRRGWHDMLGGTKVVQAE